MQYFIRIFAILTMVAIPVTGAASETLEPAGFPSLITSVRIAGPLYFCGEPVKLDIGDVRERLEKEMLLLLKAVDALAFVVFKTKNCR